MSQSFEFYTARADESAGEASAAKLTNVRDRALRSEAAWRQMADRASSIEQERVTTAREKEERRAAEQLDS
ncbi:hypothetical protein [Altericroceibacterium xinjiangense]|uniref:hypothetical protein n=1 Tax=Altericroceibacterium xinjiangense TaxID=762261 RepID=UPI000F7E511C|nr:hypothetical protein [Altericroceibacterium xinjiangense]